MSLLLSSVLFQRNVLDHLSPSLYKYLTVATIVYHYQYQGRAQKFRVPVQLATAGRYGTLYGPGHQEFKEYLTYLILFHYKNT